MEVWLNNHLPCKDLESFAFIWEAIFLNGKWFQVENSANLMNVSIVKISCLQAAKHLFQWLGISKFSPYLSRIRRWITLLYLNIWQKVQEVVKKQRTNDFIMKTCYNFRHDITLPSCPTGLCNNLSRLGKPSSSLSLS